MNSSLDTNNNVIDHLGQLTQMLHNCLSELGHDQRLQQASIGVSSSKDGLAYVVNKTTQAAECSLLAIENAKPILENLAANATNLYKLWHQMPEITVTTIADHPVLNNTLKQTLDFLNDIPEQTSSTQAYLTEIMVAQNFHDLTSQVIQKITHMIETIEQEIQQLLVEEDSTKKEASIEKRNDLMNGPVINPLKQDDVYANQEQVDNLLTKLGF